MDIQKAKKDISTLLEKGAPEDVVNEYMRDHGVTKDMLRAHEKAPESVWEQARNLGDSLATYSGAKAVYRTGRDFADYIGDAYTGDVDPAFRDVEGFRGQGLSDFDDMRSILPAINKGKMTTITDKGFGGVIKQSLGDRLIDTKQDKFGQEIITYRGSNGEPVTTYVNKPGFDGQDLDRFIHSALPFVAGAGILGTGARVVGTGILGRTVGQGVTAGLVDSGMQKIARDQGSGEDYSLGRSLGASLGGAGGEVLGTAVTKIFSKGYIDKATGKLNEYGREWAMANKVDPDAVNGSISKYLGQNIDRAVDPEELAVQARAGEFGIETTKAQRTKSPTDAFNELQMEKGLMGRDAESAMKNFRAGQNEAVERAAFDQIGRELAPEAPGADRAALGQSIGEGLDTVYRTFKKEENRLWGEIGPMYPRSAAFESMNDIISRKADEAGMRLLPKGTEASAEMAQLMERFKSGELKSSGMGILKSRANDNGLAPNGSLKDFLLKHEKRDHVPAASLFDDWEKHRKSLGMEPPTVSEFDEQVKVMGLQPKRFANRIRYDLSGLKLSNNALSTSKEIANDVVDIDEARRILLATKNTADPGSPDARLANKLYEGFNEWIDDAAEKALIIADDPAAHAKLKSARAFSRENFRVFAPTNKDGKLTQAGRKFKDFMDYYDSPEAVISSIFGRGNSITELPKGSYETIVRLNQMLKTMGTKMPEAKQAYDSIKLAYWVRLVQDKNGKVLSANKIKKNIDAALNLHKSAIGVMFNKKEIGLIKRFRAAMNDLHVEHPNPSLLFNKKEIGLIKRFRAAMNDLHVEHPNPSLSSIGVGHLTKQLGKQALQTQSKRELFSKHNVLMSRIYSMLARSIDTPIVSPGRALSRRATGQHLTTRSRNERAAIPGGLSGFGGSEYYED